jgi:hypothetical protein
MANNDFSAQIVFGGITFNTYAADATTPVQKWFADIDGWDAAPRLPVTLPNITSDGEDPVAGFLAPRPITINGTCQVTSATPMADLKAARERLMRAVLVLPTALATILVGDPVATQALVYASADAPKWEVLTCVGAVGLARFQFGLVAPDPRKYAQTVQTVALGNGIATPFPTATASATGGSLVSNTYGYRVSAVNGAGETVASSEVQASLAPLATPGTPSLTFGATGSLAPGFFAYRITAVNASGQTLASPEAFIFVGGSGSVISISVAWAPVPGATGYNVYGRTFGSEQKLTATPVIGTSFVDTGAVTPSGALPSSNTTGTTTGSVALAWTAVPGATGYNVYGRTPGAELKMTPSPTSATTFTDTGSVTPSGALPSGGFATTATNGGTYPTRPTLTVNGAATSPVSLSIGGRRLTVNSAVASGSVLIVDTAAKTVTLNGVLRMDLIDNASQWPVLSPGSNAVVYTGGGTASLAFQDAYG